MKNNKSFLKKLASFDGNKYLLKSFGAVGSSEFDPSKFDTDPNDPDAVNSDVKFTAIFHGVNKEYIYKNNKLYNASSDNSSEVTGDEIYIVRGQHPLRPTSIKEIQIALNQLNAASRFIEESVGSIKFYKKDKKKALEEDGLWGPQTQMAISIFSLPRDIKYDPKNKGAFLESVKKEIPKAQPSASLPSTGITSADIPVYSSSAGPPSRVPLPKP
jgi:hypothetical protein